MVLPADGDRRGGAAPGGPPARRARHRHLLSGRDVHGFLRARQQAGLVWQRDVERSGLD